MSPVVFFGILLLLATVVFIVLFVRRHGFAATWEAIAGFITAIAAAVLSLWAAFSGGGSPPAPT